MGRDGLREIVSGSSALGQQSRNGAVWSPQPICFSPHLYRARSAVERLFNRSNSVGGSRRATTRANYLTFIQLASIRLWLRLNESTP
jgi:transposase